MGGRGSLGRGGVRGVGLGEGGGSMRGLVGRSVGRFERGKRGCWMDGWVGARIVNLFGGIGEEGREEGEESGIVLRVDVCWAGWLLGSCWVVWGWLLVNE